MNLAIDLLSQSSVTLNSTFFLDLIKNSIILPHDFVPFLKKNDVFLSELLDVEQDDLSLSNNFDIIEMLNEYDLSGILIEVMMPRPTDFCLNDTNSYDGYKNDLNDIVSTIIHAPTIEDALIKANNWHNTIVEEAFTQQSKA